jgi:hypothetical protein
MAREAVRRHELLFGLGQYRGDTGLVFRQAGAPGRVGLTLASGLRVPPGRVGSGPDSGL